MSIIDECRQKIEESDIVLIGFGREFQTDKIRILESIDEYKKLKIDDSPLNEDEKEWIKSTFVAKTVKKGKNTLVKESVELYNSLAGFLKEKGKNNYFVVTTCNDDIIIYSDFDEERMVAPCGTYRYMKCDKGCFKHVYDTKEVFDNIYDIITRYTADDSLWDRLREAMPQCPMCKQVMSINHYKTNNYSAEGYRTAWDSYMAWLQKTLNRKLVMLELGEGFETPTVIRWPFEKTAAVNNKATLIRVNVKLWQIAEDIEDKTVIVKESGKTFIKSLIG